MPPILFHDLLEDLIPVGELKHEINTLLMRKVSGEELDLEKKIEVINHYLEHEIGQLEIYSKSLSHDSIDPTSRLDQLFRNTLVEVWETLGGANTEMLRDIIEMGAKRGNNELNPEE